jgi:hypothetical protein
MDLFTYASGHLSGQIGDAPAPIHYREKYHRGAPDTPDEIGGYRGSAPDTFPFPGASVGDSLKNETSADPAKNYPTKASIKVADDAWNEEYVAWQAAGCPGGPDAWPRPPVGLLSAVASHCTKPRNRGGASQWRK